VSGLSSTDYTITFVNGTLLISPKALTVTADDKQVSYGTAPVFSATGSGFAFSDTLASLSGPASFGGSAVGAVHVGSYPITVSGLTASDYTISFLNGTLKIDPKALTVTAGSQEVTYGTVAAPFSATGNGFAYSDSLASLSGAAVFGGSALGAVHAGNYTISVSGLTATDYTINFVNGTLQIDAKALTVTANSQEVTYGTAPAPFSATGSGFAYSDSLASLSGTAVFGGSAVGAVHAGSYAISVSGLTATDYSLSFVNGTLKIDPKALTVTAVSQEVTYGTAPAPVSATGSGFAYSDTLASLSGTATFGGQRDHGEPRRQLPAHGQRPDLD